ncbi:MAG: glycerol acyltransferase [Chlorobi bacterium]|nr:glycerol acyltransferase [Chlorobiota bacterium]
MTNDNQTALIDINRIIKNKNPELHKRLPKFVINYIKKVIRQDELNEFIGKNNQYSGIDFLRHSFDYFNVRAEIEGRENFPENSRIIIAANHPAGSFDGLHIINTCYEKYGKAKALVNDLLLNVKNLNEFFLGVNKYGKTRKEHLAEIKKIFESDMPIIFFPAGMVSRRQNGIIRDLEWQKSFITQAVKHKRDIVPVYISGQLSNKFYITANIRKKVGIKANLELFLLPQELTKQRNSIYHIKIGKAVSYKTFTSEYKETEWAQMMKSHIYEIAKDINAKFEANRQTIK